MVLICFLRSGTRPPLSPTRPYTHATDRCVIEHDRARTLSPGLIRLRRRSPSFPARGRRSWRARRRAVSQEPAKSARVPAGGGDVRFDLPRTSDAIRRHKQPEGIGHSQVRVAICVRHAASANVSADPDVGTLSGRAADACAGLAQPAPLSVGGARAALRAIARRCEQSRDPSSTLRCAFASQRTAQVVRSPVCRSSQCRSDDPCGKPKPPAPLDIRGY
jgi:hypothetical protein